MSKFIADPEKYLRGMSLLAPPLCGRLPIPLPADIPSEKIAELAIQAHCPVTLSFDTHDRRCVIPGSQEFQVQFGEYVFRMANSTARRAFIERPWLYSDLVLPTKMPAPPASVPLDDFLLVDTANKLWRGL